MNAQGDQSVLLHVVADSKASIANYDQVHVETECMWDYYRHDDLSALYATLLDDAFDHVDAGWAVEYAWTEGKCDPCTGSTFSQDSARQLGWTGDTYDSPYVTRIYARYSPEAATQDLGVYLTGLTDTFQLRYVSYLPELESSFPVCIDGWESDDRGTCTDATSTVPLPHDHRGPFAMLFALAGGLWWRRRKAELFPGQRRSTAR